jgi:hypothetical protein
MKSLPKIAAQFVGIQEIPNNQGWKDEFLSHLMESVGFQKGWAWCALFAQVCTELYLAQFDSSLINKYRKCFSPSAVSTYNNFKKHYPDMVSSSPEKNAIIVWQKYKDGKQTAQGHEGIFCKFNQGWVTSIDGNTNEAGSREGDGVYRKMRDITTNKQNGLVFLGFINFPDFEENEQS